MLCLTAQGCASRPAAIGEKPAAVVVAVKDKPPADLLICPVKVRRPASAPGGVLPEEKRRWLGQLAASYDQVFDQLTRLVTWNDPTACKAEEQR